VGVYPTVILLTELFLINALIPMLDKGLSYQIHYIF
jgi:hypothetical protein